MMIRKRHIKKRSTTTWQRKRKTFNGPGSDPDRNVRENREPVVWNFVLYGSISCSLTKRMGREIFIFNNRGFYERKRKLSKVQACFLRLNLASSRVPEPFLLDLGESRAFPAHVAK